jgi:hypothetical protein
MDRRHEKQPTASLPVFTARTPPASPYSAQSLEQHASEHSPNFQLESVEPEQTCLSTHPTPLLAGPIQQTAANDKEYAQWDPDEVGKRYAAYLDVEELDEHRQDEIRRYNRQVLDLIKLKCPSADADKKFVDVLCTS